MNTTAKLTDDEYFAQYRQEQKEFAERQLLEHKASIEAFREFSAAKGIDLTDENFAYVPTIGIVAVAPGIVDRLIGVIKRERDRLISFDTLAHNYSSNPHQAGYLRSDHFMLMAHPHFRRGLYENNNFAPRFIDIFWGLKTEGAERYIALDEDRVRINVDDSAYFEADTWYGAPFDDDISRIQSGISKLRPPLDLEDTYVSLFFANAYCLDVKWSQKENIKTFQALELKSDESFLILGREKFFPARYIHAEFDLNIGAFRHFDGAVQYYTESEYIQRRESDFNYNAKNQAQIKSRSKKLFKLNGRIETKIWVQLCCHFLTGNPLVFEYYTGKYPAHVEQALSRIRGRSSQHGNAA